MGRKITMARNPWKVLALGRLHAHPPRGYGVPAIPGRRDRALAGRAAQATPGRGTRGGSIHLVLQGRAGPGGERDSRRSEERRVGKEGRSGWASYAWSK